jgi:hypothetical protein
MTPRPTLRAIMSGSRLHPAALPLAALLRDCDETRTRRGGPGGQHRNKVETAVVLRHRPTGIEAEAAERRSQAENRRMAVARLRLALALGVRMPPAGDAASPLWRSRARGGRLAVAADHDDYPAIVAEALDRLTATGCVVAPAATQLGVTATQFVNLFRKTPAAWTTLNRLRTEAGLRPLS